MENIKTSWLNTEAAIRSITVEDEKGNTFTTTFPTEAKYNQLQREDKIEKLWPRVIMADILPNDKGESAGVQIISQGCTTKDITFVTADLLGILIRRAKPEYMGDVITDLLMEAISSVAEGNPLVELIMVEGMIRGLERLDK